ncbi:hypothetical protein [Streptomyces sp. NPDC001508]|uniref:hypothetical protein n=1 Tax=Streptomyces sp. NPDC001508 TaxID=3154656 RepID=UPI003329EDE4
MNQGLPPVAPSVTAELVGALTPRLRKRLDAGVTKLAGRPVVRDGDTVRIAVDDTTDLELHAPGGTVTSADAVRCGCLLAPDCLHRAAAACAAPVAAPEATGEEETAEEPGACGQPGTGTPGAPGARAAAESTPAGDATVGAGPAPSCEDGAVTAGPAGPAGSETAGPETATPGQRAAAQDLRHATAAVLEAGADGAGAVLQAELLRAAHTARLAGLPRAATAALSVVTAVRAARSADPAYRLADLVAALHEVLTVAHLVPHATGAELAALRGTVRQPYTPDGSLRLYGVFSEPVLTATGYAGAVTWTADAQGRLYSVSDVAPGGAGRAMGAADRTVRIGDTALTHRALARAGLAVSGATVSPTGRLGAGSAVRAVRASGAAWSEPPLAGLWAVPVADQVDRALDDGHDLLFLDVTLVGTVRETTGEALLAECGGLTLRLAAAHDHPALPDRDNLRLLAAACGSRLRIVARLTPAAHPRALLLAASRPTDPDTRVDVGLDRLLRSDLPTGPPPAAGAPRPAPDEAPLYLLRRRIQQAASGGRRVLAFSGGDTADRSRLRRHGLATAADLVDALHSAAADRARDPFGRLLPADRDRFARRWLAAARYTEEVDRALCAAAWGAGRRSPVSAARTH